MPPPPAAPAPAPVAVPAQPAPPPILTPSKAYRVLHFAVGAFRAGEIVTVEKFLENGAVDFARLLLLGAIEAV